MAEQAKKSTKVQESRENMVAIIFVFCVNAWLANSGKGMTFDVLLVTYGAILGKMGAFMWAKGKEYDSNTKVEVAKAKVIE